jgi:Ser/Thr protein kinase RdoA (MazF antagonist)
VAGHHGDLWAGNLFISDRSVEVIDFEGFRDGLPLEDVAYFLSYLELLPLAAFDYPRMERAFLGGYLEDEQLDRRALELFKVMHAIRTLARMVDRHSLHDRLVRRTLTKTVRRSVR